MPREIHLPTGAARRARQGIASCLEGRFDEAIAALEPLAGRKDPVGRRAERHLGLAHRQAGLLALGAGRLEQAESHLRRAEAILGPRSHVQEALLELHASGGRFDRCAEELERALRGRPDDASLWRRLAQAQWRTGRRAEAHLTLQTALRRLGQGGTSRRDGPARGPQSRPIAPAGPPAPLSGLHVQEGLFLAAEDRLAEARESFARAAEADGECPDAHYYLGLATAATGRPREAAESLQRSAELRARESPQGPPIAMIRDWGLLTYQLALASRAAQQAGAAVPMHWTHLGRPPVAVNRDGSLFPDPLAAEAAPPPDAHRRGRSAPPPPRELIEAILKSYEGLAPHELAARDRDQLEALVRLLRQAALRRPCPAEVHGYCAEALEALGREAEALPHAERAADGQADPRAGVRLGRLLAKLGRREEAVTQLEAAAGRGADWADVHCLLGELLWALGRRSPAEAHLNRSLQLNPNFRRAEGLRQRLAA